MADINQLNDRIRSVERFLSIFYGADFFDFMRNEHVINSLIRKCDKDLDQSVLKPFFDSRESMIRHIRVKYGLNK